MARTCGGVFCTCRARAEWDRQGKEGPTMTTEKQTDANRRNALQSTGPRTPEGKARSSWNATVHGLTSARVLMPDEDAEAFRDFGARLFSDLDPVGELEEMLADRIVSTAWRLRRAVKVEAAVFDRRADGNGNAYAHGRELYRVITIGGDEGKTALNLSRYEAALERSLYRALHELERLQKSRKGQQVPAPGVVDLTVAGDADGFVSQ